MRYGRLCQCHQANTRRQLSSSCRDIQTTSVRCSGCTYLHLPWPALCQTGHNHSPLPASSANQDYHWSRGQCLAYQTRFSQGWDREGKEGRTEAQLQSCPHCNLKPQPWFCYSITEFRRSPVLPYQRKKEPHNSLSHSLSPCTPPTVTDCRVLKPKEPRPSGPAQSVAPCT